MFRQIVANLSRLTEDSKSGILELHIIDRRDSQQPYERFVFKENIKRLLSPIFIVLIESLVLAS